ncbi:MAG: NADH:ubiquinone oxidoreductase subunit 4 (chain M) [Pseudoclavibacter sp.]
MSGEPTVVTSATRHRPSSYTRPAGIFLVAALAAPFIPWEAAQARAAETENSRSYVVGDSAALSPAPTAGDAAAWETFVKIATPETASELLTSYTVFDDPESETHASVGQSAEDPALWALEVNAAGEGGLELEQTMVHEYAHLLSLNPDEVALDRPSCTTLVLAEGCALPGSMLVSFHEQFWAAYGSEAPSADNADVEVAEAFYEQHEEAFVDDYAATNVVEDFAETYMVFVVEERPGSDSAVAEKLDFFWDRPSEVERRDRIRAALGWEGSMTVEPSAAGSAEVEVGTGTTEATEQSIPRAAIVTIAVLSALIIVLLVAFVVWMRRRAHAEAAEGDVSAGGGTESS